MPTLCQRKKGQDWEICRRWESLQPTVGISAGVQCISMGVNGLYYTLISGQTQYRYGEIIGLFSFRLFNHYGSKSRNSGIAGLVKYRDWEIPLTGEL